MLKQNLLLRKRMPVRQRALSFCGLTLWLLCCLSLAGCQEQTHLPEGVVATVNGEPIHLRRVQALLDTRSAALGVMQSPSLELMKARYGRALGTLIIHVLIRQELQTYEIAVSQPVLEREVAKVRRDYAQWGKDAPQGKQGLAGYLVDESLDEEQWLELMRDQLAIQTFERRILLPTIEVSLAEIRDYYAAHAQEFQLPERYILQAVSAASRELVQQYCEAVSSGQKSLPARVTAHSVEIPAAEIAAPWKKELTRLKPAQCARPRQQDGLWQTVLLEEHLPAQVLDVAGAYPLIEQILLDQKKQKAFELWLEKTLQKARVRVSPLLSKELLAAEQNQNKKAEPGEPEGRRLEMHNRAQRADDADGPEASEGPESSDSAERAEAPGAEGRASSATGAEAGRGRQDGPGSTGPAAAAEQKQKAR